MRKWKQLKKTIRLKSLLNLNLNKVESSALKHRNLKVKDGIILATNKWDRYARDFHLIISGG